MTNTQGAGERWWDYDSANQEIVNYAKAPDVEQFACIDPDDMRDVVEELNRLTAQAGLAQQYREHLTRPGVDWRDTDTFEAQWLNDWDALAAGPTAAAGL